MKKRSDRTAKSQTHFEQVPLVVVKKIAGGDVASVESAGPDDGRVTSISSKRPQQTVPAHPARRKGR